MLCNFGRRGIDGIGVSCGILVLVGSIGTEAKVIGLKTHGYVSESVVRKIILAEFDSGRWAEPLAAMSVKDLIEMYIGGGVELPLFSEEGLGIFRQLFCMFVA